MRLKTIAIGLMGLSSPLLIWASTFPATTYCQVDEANNEVVAIGQKSPGFPLMLLLGFAQGALALYLTINDKSAQEKQQKPVLSFDNKSAGMLPESSNEKLEMPDLDSSRKFVENVSQSNREISYPIHSPIRTQSFNNDLIPKEIPKEVESKILKLAASRLSIVFSAPPETGKTVTVLSWLFEVFERYPEAVVFIAGWKNDPWLGLNQVPGIVSVISADSSGIDFQPLIDQVDKVLEILEVRRQTPKHLRNFDNLPVWLILDDYYATINCLSTAAKYKAKWEDLKVKIGFIITIGREFFVNAAIATHSLNIAALGISDSNIRGCLNLCALGKVSRNVSDNNNNREDGGFGSISKALGNHLIVDEREVREKLLNSDFPKLRKESDRTGQPIMFCSMGSIPTLELLPDLRWAEKATLSDDVLDRLAKKTGVAIPQLSYTVRNQLESLASKHPELDKSEVTGYSNEEKVLSDADYRLQNTVTRLLSNGIPRSRIIKDFWGFNGRNYSEGCAKWDTLMGEIGKEEIEEIMNS